MIGTDYFLYMYYIVLSGGFSRKSIWTLNFGEVTLFFKMEPNVYFSDSDDDIFITQESRKRVHIREKKKNMMCPYLIWI